MDTIDRPRSKAAIIAVIGWWVAAICAVGSWYLLNSQVESQVRAGSWLLGFAMLGSLTGWAGSIGTMLRDRGRIRLGGGLLLAIPIVGVIFSIPMMNSTVLNPSDPLPAVMGIVSGLLLIVGTLLIIAPNRSH